MKIAASILAADFKQLGDDLVRAEKGGADLIHIDVMDGHFVPNLGIGPMIVKSVREATTLPFSVHLMVEEPRRFVKPYIEAGADTVIVHAEAFRGLYRTIELIKQSKKRVGIAVNPSTPLSALTHLLEDIDLILIMSVDPGFGGQPFIPTMLSKITEARTLIDQVGKDIDLAVDGGVNTNTADSVVNAGANLLIMGSAIFRNRNIEDNIKNIRHLVS